ncbi:MAG: SDR family oxidoreductase [Burkholderiaceae bacterium]
MTQHVLVTGGSNGIGKAIVDRLAQDGLTPINLDINPPAAPNGIHVPIDLLDIDALRSCVSELQSRYAITRLVNNAGMVQPASLEETDIAAMRKVARLNLEVPVLLAQSLLPAMKSAGFGRIVNISSRAALGKELRSAYSASKAGLIGLTRTWALELARHGITVNAIGPGPIATELFMNANPPDSERTRQILASVPLQRLGQPEDVAHGVASFMDDRAGFITGQVLYICGGMTVGLCSV